MPRILLLRKVVDAICMTFSLYNDLRRPTDELVSALSFPGKYGTNSLAIEGLRLGEYELNQDPGIR